MDYKKVSSGPGWFSLAAGAPGLSAPRRITGAVDARWPENIANGFGVREFAAGATARNSPRTKAAWGRWHS